MAIRSKRSGVRSTRTAKAKSKTSAAARKKAGARKKAAERTQKKSAKGKKKAARKQKTTRKTTRKKSASERRGTGASSRSASARHPAAIARLYPERIGTVLHYYAQAGGAIIQLERGEVHVGDAVHIRGHTTDFYERIEEMKLDDRAVEIARGGQTVGIRVSRTVRENDGVFLLSE